MTLAGIALSYILSAQAGELQQETIEWLLWDLQTKRYYKATAEPETPQQVLEAWSKLEWKLNDVHSTETNLQIQQNRRGPDDGPLWKMQPLPDKKSQ